MNGALTGGRAASRAGPFRYEQEVQQVNKSEATPMEE
jgi:hypothetical protein